MKQILVTFRIKRKVVGFLHDVAPTPKEVDDAITKFTKEGLDLWGETDAMVDWMVDGILGGGRAVDIVHGERNDFMGVDKL